MDSGDAGVSYARKRTLRIITTHPPLGRATRRHRDLVPPDPQDTGPGLRAYLASVQPLTGSDRLERDERYRRGRELIERMAASARQGPAALRLSVVECADVLHFITCSEPRDPPGWWDPDTAPSPVIGLYCILQSVEASLRRSAPL
jgi:hypothetical protein